MIDEPRKSEGTGANPDSHAGVTAAAAIDWPGLEARYARRPQFVDRLAEIALTSMRGLPAQLREAADAGRAADIVAVAHSLRTGTDVIMAYAARDLAERVERSCRGGAAEAVALARSLADVVEQLLVSLQNRVDRRPR